MAAELKQYKMGSLVFRLKPTSPGNVKRFNEVHAAYLTDDGDGDESLEKFYWEAFKVITSGAHDSLDYEEDFDMKVVEVALSDFLPYTRLTTFRLTGFLPLSSQGHPEALSKLLG